MMSHLIDWLIDCWLIVRFIGCLIELAIDWLVGWLVYLSIYFGSCWLMMNHLASSYKKGWTHVISPYDKKKK